MGKWTDRWVYFWNIFSLGQGQIGRIKDFANLQILLLLLANIGIFFPDYAQIVLPEIIGRYLFLLIFIGVVVYNTSCFMLGLFLDKKYKVIHAEASFKNYRDPQIQEILARLKRIESKQ